MMLAAVTAGGLVLAAVQAAPAASRTEAAAARTTALPPVGAVVLSGPMRADPAIHYRTALARPSQVSVGTVSSTNWAGYAVTANSGRTVAKIIDVFTAPSVNCASSTIGSSGEAVFSDWAGLDGFTSDTVEQAGTGAFCTSTTSPPTYFAFYEMFPLDVVTFTGVSPGDAISVIVQKVSTGWSLLLQDHTTGGVISTVQPCPTGSVCHDANGEVISEAFNGSVPEGFDLADFGLDNQTDISLATARGNTGTLNTTAGLWTSSQVVMVNGADRMANPGPLYGGQAFYLEWKASS